MGKILYKRKVLKDELKKDEHFRLKRQLQANLTGRNLKIIGEKVAQRSTFETEIGVTAGYLSMILGIANRGSNNLIQAVENKNIEVRSAYEISKKL